MQHLKRHYEKIILGLVLVGLTVALAGLPFKIAGERQTLEESRRQGVTVTPVPLKALELARQQAALAPPQSRAAYEYTGAHNLFNPVRWQRVSDGRMLKEQNVDPLAGLQITKVSPLYLTVTYDSTNASGHLVRVRRETRTGREADINGFMTLEKPNLQSRNLLILREVRAGAEQTPVLVLELVETGEKITLAPGAQHRRVDGWSVDMKPPEAPARSNIREGGVIRFGGEEYTVRSIKEVAPGEHEIVLSAKSTEKKTTKRFKLP